MTSQRQSTTAALIVVAVVFCTTMLAVLLSFLFAPPGSDATVVIGPLLGTLAPTIAAVALLVQVNTVKQAQAEQSVKVEKIAKDTHDLTNGLLDSKLRAGIADVAHPSFIRPDAHEQIAEDRAARARSHHDGDDPATG